MRLFLFQENLFFILLILIKKRIMAQRLFFLPFWVVTLFWAGIASAQIFPFRVWTLKEGLPQVYVKAICQDSRGFIWLGAQTGLTRFDGVNFKVYTTSEGKLPNNTINVLCEDKVGRLWVGTRGGLCYFDGKYFWSYTTQQGLIDNYINALLCAESGALYIGSRSGLCKLQGKRIEPLNEINALLPNPYVTALAEASDGDLLIGTKSGLLRVNPKNHKDATVINGLPDNYINVIVAEGGTNFWVGTEGGLAYLTKESIQIFTQKDGLPDNAVHALHLSQNGNLWIGTPKGLANLENHRISVYNVGNGLPDDIIAALQEDNQGGLWIGTEGGLARFEGKRFTCYSTQHGLPHNTVWCIRQDTEGKLWISSEAGLALVLNPGPQENPESYKFRVFTTANGLISNQIRTIYPEKDGSLLLGTRNGLCRFRESGGCLPLLTVKDGLPANYVRALARDAEGFLWIGTTGGLARFDGKKLSVFSKRKYKIIPDEYISALLLDSEGKLWIGTEGGTVTYQNGKFYPVIAPKGITKASVRTLFEDTRGCIWIGTDNGLVCYDKPKQKWSRYTMREGLRSNVIWNIVEDAKGFIWVGHEKGVERLDPAAGAFKYYGYLDGFLPLETNSNSAFRDNAGNLWFGTIGGAVKYQPKEDLPNLYPPQIYLTQLLVNGKKLDWELYADSVDKWLDLPVSRKKGEPAMALPHYFNNLSFSFVGIHYASPEKVKYRFRLEGVNKEYSDLTDRTIVDYSELKPGKYTFYVRAVNKDGVWVSEDLAFSFEILPAWYQQWWFYLLLVFSGGGGIAALVRLRTQNLRRQNQYLEKIVNERTRELLEEKLKIEATVQERTQELRKEKENVEAKNKEIEQKNAEIESKNQQLTAVLQELAAQNNDLRESIIYARRIQEAILPSKEEIEKHFSNCFILYIPRDIVSGDFYWVHRHKEDRYIVAADCTGHGVPGAFMSLIGYTLLNKIVNELQIEEPSKILDQLHVEVRQALKQHHMDSESRDGMDISICRFNLQTKTAQFAGANHTLLYFREHKDLIEIKGNKYPIGGRVLEDRKDFTLHNLEVAGGAMLYLFTDGYLDQFGGPLSKKFMMRNFKDLLKKIHHLPLERQRKELKNELDKWKGENPQLDDILVIGIQI
jgi:ligand-binding sensor domain-containing protein/serine phosphatase RsbU (regulator of sigma subunit)